MVASATRPTVTNGKGPTVKSSRSRDEFRRGDRVKFHSRTLNDAARHAAGFNGLRYSCRWLPTVAENYRLYSWIIPSNYDVKGSVAACPLAPVCLFRFVSASTTPSCVPRVFLRSNTVNSVQVYRFQIPIHACPFFPWKVPSEERWHIRVVLHSFCLRIRVS